EIVPEGYTLTGNLPCMLPARVSYFLNLQGPSVAVDTACSSSLVAVHLACESIRNRTCDFAIAGGVALLTTPQFVLNAVQAGMLASDGCCKTFDARADGMGYGEAVGMVVLKPLLRAIQDGDQIYGVIKGSGMNQDGKTNGITAPSAPSQTRLYEEIYRRFAVDPLSISYVEAHGTGTKLGDPIEIDALTDAFRKFTPAKQFSAIGLSGTNCRVVLAEAPPGIGLKRPRRQAHLVCLSAKAPKALRQRVKDLAAWIGQNDDESLLSDLAYTLDTGRSHFEYRAAFVAESIRELRERLDGYEPGGTTETGERAQDLDDAGFSRLIQWFGIGSDNDEALD